MTDDLPEIESEFDAPRLSGAYYRLLAMMVDDPRMTAAEIGERLRVSGRTVERMKRHPQFRAMLARRLSNLVDATVVGALEDGIEARQLLNRARRNGIAPQPQTARDPELTTEGIGPPPDDPDAPVDPGRLAVARDQRDQAIKLASTVVKLTAMGNRPTALQGEEQEAGPPRSLDDLLDEAAAEDVGAEIQRHIAEIQHHRAEDDADGAR